MVRVFVDGQHGTTGLEIHRLLGAHPNIELVEIGVEQRRDEDMRRALMNSVDAIVLCLPDDAAIAAVAMVTSPSTRILDASTAHRTDSAWVYGLPELPRQRQDIRAARRVSNPGCYPTGFLLAVRPLIDSGLIAPELALTTHAISGYSGGGKKLIERFEAAAKTARCPDELLHNQDYGLNLNHKHLPEMHRYSGTHSVPLFSPSVGHFYRGMVVHVPLFAHQLHSGAIPSGEVIEAIVESWRAAYANERFIHVGAPNDTTALAEGYFDPQGANHTNRVELRVYGNAERVLLTARLDNLGKGAGGAAVQNLNLMFGFDEGMGLTA